MKKTKWRDEDMEGDPEVIALIKGGSTISLEQAVTELLSCADDMLTPEERPPNAHGGAYLDRYRFERLRRALQARLGAR